MLNEVDPTTSGIRRRPPCALCRGRKGEGEVAVFAERRRQLETWTTVGEIHRCHCCSACGAMIYRAWMEVVGGAAARGCLNLDECDFCRDELLLESWVVEARGPALGGGQQFRVCVPCGQDLVRAVETEFANTTDQRRSAGPTVC
ncbi:MAG: hypothetical protein IT304_11000 [Dehalococcoidia bacterium]|nr:hypothetical protein [Dehalococcoidia bacterium]